MGSTATVTLKKGEETQKRDIYDEAGVKAGNTYVIGGETWVVDKVHGKEPEKQPDKPAKPDLIAPPPKPPAKPAHKPPAKAAPAKHHSSTKKSYRR